MCYALDEVLPTERAIISVHAHLPWLLCVQLSSLWYFLLRLRLFIHVCLPNEKGSCYQ